MRDVASRFQKRRKEKATAHIDLPEVKIRVVDGEVTIKPLPSLKSRELVTEAMLMAGEAAAKFALLHNIPFAYTTQIPPEVAERPTDLAAMFAYRKKMKPSQMKSNAEPHSGLGLDAYARATSPLRRYLDLVVHQQLRSHLKGEPVMGPQDVLSRVGAAEAVLGQVRRAERASNQHWTLVYLIKRPGWTGTGILVDKHGQRGTAIIPELGLESRVFLGTDAALNGELRLKLNGINLPELQAHFMVMA
jgi:exoribonuclease-2